MPRMAMTNDGRSTRLSSTGKAFDLTTSLLRYTPQLFRTATIRETSLFMEPEVSISFQQHSRTALEEPTSEPNFQPKNIVRKAQEEMIRRLLRDPVKVTAIIAGVLVW